MQVGEILYLLRGTRGLSQDRLAQALGISASYLSLLERGKRPATIKVMRTLANWLGVAPGLLILQSMDPGSLEIRPRRLVREIQRQMQKALASGNFTALEEVGRD
ncbi:MAG TPA: helix-turn-helix transcriptional regulator [Terriglobia bacterium]|nr:helix-turn-helix transcriptional regulator [Terriglobia bacterium]